MSVATPVMALKVTKSIDKAKAKAKAKAAKAKAKEERIPISQALQTTQLTPTLHYHFWVKSTGFNFLPKEQFHPIIYSHLTQFPTNLKKRHAFLNKEFPLKMPLSLALSLTTAVTADTLDWTQCSPTKSLTIRKALGKIMKVRFLFRKLLHHMRMKRLRISNTDDLVTMEPPKKLVEIVDWASRQKYRFEANTIMKDITCRLMTHDGFFEEPQEPRNPFTNIPFTQSQTISLWNSISCAGIPVSLAFTAFRQARYSLRNFSLYYSTLIKLNALEKTMKDLKSYHYRERMIDFISFCYSEEICTCNVAAFTYCLVNYPDYQLLKRWAALCFRFYKAEILYSTDIETLKKIKDSIIDSSIELINNDMKINNLYTVSNDIIHFY